MTRIVFALLSACVVLLGSPSAGTAEVLDSGTYHVFQGDRPLGKETFAFERLTDSLYIYSHVTQTIPSPHGDLSLEKTSRLLLNEFDANILLYESQQQLNDHKLVRAIYPSDTVLTVVREKDDRGESLVIARPPGRLFILDPQVFVLFDVVCREMSGRPFKQRPIQMFVLSDRDTALEATATDHGTETIRWGSKTVKARHISIADANSEFFFWAGPQGHMLRLTQPKSGLRVERGVEAKAAADTTHGGR